MNHLPIARVFVTGTLLFLLASHLTAAQKQKPGWTWVDSSGTIRPGTELDEIVGNHRRWAESNEKSGSYAILDGSDLHNANLTDAILSGAQLNSANLTDALLVGANLSGAVLRRAHLNGTVLIGANLSGAVLYDADLRGAVLTGTQLNGADLRDTDLTNALVGGSNLGLVIFEPKSLPTLRTIAGARNLQLVTYGESPDALFQLRKQFQDGGFRKQEREITYAIKRRETERAWQACKSRTLDQDKTRAILWSSDSNLANCGSFVLNRVFFDWTCQFGMSPGRPLSLGVLLWLLCSALYFLCIHAAGKTGLFRISSASLEHEADPSAHRTVKPIKGKSFTQTRGTGRLLQIVRCEWLLFRTSMFFSLMSAFNIGFRDINFGRWLRLLTRQEFDIKAVGWARVVAGWQSLVSVYLLALWVLTEFSRPFG